MNKIIFSGNLGKDSELQFLPGTGKAILKFSVGVARGFKREDGTDWLNCTLFGERAEKLAQYLIKGTKVLAEGTLRLNNYEAKDGTKRYSTDILVNNIEMLGGKGESNTEYKEKPIEDMQEVEDDSSDVPF